MIRQNVLKIRKRGRFVEHRKLAVGVANVISRAQFHCINMEGLELFKNHGER